MSTGLLEARRVSVVALTGMTFDLGSATGRMMATVLAGIAEFERDLLRERVRSGLAAARARGRCPEPADSTAWHPPAEPPVPPEAEPADQPASTRKRPRRRRKDQN